VVDVTNIDLRPGQCRWWRRSRAHTQHTGARYRDTSCSKVVDYRTV